jgi:predicted transcriptional regulator
MSPEFFIDINPSDRTNGPRVDSTSNRNEYREYFLGVNAAGAYKADNLYDQPVPLSINLGTLTSWNPLGHSRPVTGHLYLYLYL